MTLLDWLEKRKNEERLRRRLRGPQISFDAAGNKTYKPQALDAEFHNGQYEAFEEIIAYLTGGFENAKNNER